MTIAEWRNAGAEVAVIGLGRSGYAATRLLLARGVRVYASDAAAPDRLEAIRRELVPLGAAVDLGMHDLARIRRAAAVILSPGVPPDAEAVAAARDAGVPIRAELDLGIEAMEGTPYVAVTGTNGKTTTTALVASLLRAGGVGAEAAGNIGTPVTELALRADRPDWLAVEVSSFQLHDTPLIAPRVGVVTNLSPDHLDRYRDGAAYAADKALLFRNATATSVWVLNQDDPPSLGLAGDAPGRRVRFSLTGPADGWLDRDRGVLRLGEAPLLARRDLPLLGDHNVANALAAALAVQAALGTPAGVLGRALAAAEPLPHRLETVLDRDGVRWINDSKATNVASTAMALAAMDRPVILLLGGRHKGESYARLRPAIARGCRAVVAYGEAGPRVCRDLGDAVPVIPADALDEAVAAARSAAQAGDVILLSPACSSFDQFRNYEERGAVFRDLAAKEAA